MNSRTIGDFLGGVSATLVALPSAIAFGLLIYAPLGGAFAAKGVMAGIVGTVVLGILACLSGGTARLITAPCAPAAAVLAAFVTGILAGPEGEKLPAGAIPLLLILIGITCGVFQFLFGFLGGGRLIKFIPYPVVAGYLSAVGILIIIGQIPKLLGVTQTKSFFYALLTPAYWNPAALLVGLCAIVVMVASPKVKNKIPAPIFAVLGAVVIYQICSRFCPDLGNLSSPLLIGHLTSSNDNGSFFKDLLGTWTFFGSLGLVAFKKCLVTAFTLAVLLSIDTLKTCVIVDTLTRCRHDSNRELITQGIANIGSALFGGLPGAGTMGATLINMTSGGQTQLSGLFAGTFALLILILLAPGVAWVPVAGLAGILIVVGFRMVDRNSLRLLKQKTTLLDFVVVAAVVLTAVAFTLIAAAGVGVSLAILLFLRDQIQGSVVRRKLGGNQLFSKKRRLPDEMTLLEQKGEQTIIFELQGTLFFGTTDQLYSEVEPFIKKCRYFIFDMRRVQSIDFTAAHRLEQIEHQIEERQGFLIFSNLPDSLPTGQNLYEYLNTFGLGECKHSIKVFSDLSSALEWVEEQILAANGLICQSSPQPLALHEIDALATIPLEVLNSLQECVVEKTYEPNQKIFGMGEEGDQLYFIRRGEVRIEIPLGGEKALHLATFGRRDFFGDLAFLDRGTRSANAITTTETDLYILSRSEFDQVAHRHPELSGFIFSHLALVLSSRLRHTGAELRALQDA